MGFFRFILCPVPPILLYGLLAGGRVEGRAAWDGEAPGQYPLPSPRSPAQAVDPPRRVNPPSGRRVAPCAGAGRRGGSCLPGPRPRSGPAWAGVWAVLLGWARGWPGRLPRTAPVAFRPLLEKLYFY